MDNNQIISNNPFGININLSQKTAEEVKKVVKQDIEDITVNPFLSYLDDNDKVFSGEVASEIQKYNAQIYTLGQVMREGQPRSTFSMKM